VGWRAVHRTWSTRNPQWICARLLASNVSTSALVASNSIFLWDKRF